MKTPVIVIAIAATVGLWAGVSAQQETRPTPGLGSGVVTVRGTVDIGTAPSIAATQVGQWRVAVTDAPPVVVSGPEFVRKGGRYAVTWSNGDPEMVTVMEHGHGGWVQVGDSKSTGKSRWVNLATARAVEEAQ